MGFSVELTIEFDALGTIENMSKVLYCVEEAVDRIWAGTDQRVVLRGIPFYRMDIKQHLQKFSEALLAKQEGRDIYRIFWTLGPRKVHWVGIRTGFFFSPLSAMPIVLCLDPQDSGLVVTFEIGTQSFFSECLPIDDQAVRYINGEIPHDDEDWTDWVDHYIPAWPTNARYLMETVEAVQKLFPVKKIEIPDEFANPEQHAHMEPSEALQLVKPNFMNDHN